MARRARAYLVGLALVLLLATAAAAPAPAREGRTALTPLQATNQLMATPWANLGKQLELDAEHSLEGLEGKTVAGSSGNIGITHKGVGVTAKWSFGVKVHQVKAQVDLSRPPGIIAASPSEIAFAGPRTGGWSFGIQAILEPDAWVKVAGVKIWDQDALVPFAIGIKNFRVVARGELDSAEPDRPRLVRATITPDLKLGGAGIFPGVIPVTFATKVDQGKVTMRASAIVLPLAEFGFANARFNGVLTVVLRPSSFSHVVDTDAVQSTTEFMHVSVRLKGRLSAEIKYLPSAKESFDFDVLSFEGLVPSFDQLNDFLRLTKQATPRSWGEGQQRGWVPEPAEGVDYATSAATLEAGIDQHLPHGAILSIDCKPVRADPNAKGCPEYSWTGEADSALWTGHYLAAEAFRYASGDLAALPRVEKALAGVERLFWVTGDTAVVDKKRATVSDPHGLLARTAMPAAVRGRMPAVPYTRKQLAERKCYYVRPEGGWLAGGKPYSRLALVPKQLRDAATPVGQVWHGWGCADDHPVSKDQYAGVFYGLAMAHRLVPVLSVQERTGRLIRDALDFLLANGWNVRVPPKNRYETTFLGDFPKQLAFLRIGATVLGGKYLDQYLQLSPASAHTWIPIWFSAIDPVLQYYKFNLSHAALAPALLLEDDLGRRAGFAQAHAMMWRAVRHHRNAYFGLTRLLAQLPAEREAFAQTTTPWLDPNMTVEKEIRSVLQDWIRRYELVKAGTGMPTGALADPSFQASLAATDVATFVGFDGSTRQLAIFALPQTARTGSDKDFVWQRHPFDPAGSRPNRVHPGVDYLLAYWMAAYLGVLPEA
ncbi:MAG: hypothetical protein ACXWZY_01840 [Gaiellaceae bacterium]